LDHRRIVERAQQVAARLELAQQTLVVDIEAQRLGGRVEVGTVDEQRDLFLRRGHQASLVIKTNWTQQRSELVGYRHMRSNRRCNADRDAPLSRSNRVRIDRPSPATVPAGFG